MLPRDVVFRATVGFGVGFAALIIVRFVLLPWTLALEPGLFDVGLLKEVIAFAVTGLLVVLSIGYTGGTEVARLRVLRSSVVVFSIAMAGGLSTVFLRAGFTILGQQLRGGGPSSWIVVTLEMIGQAFFGAVSAAALGTQWLGARKAPRLAMMGCVGFALAYLVLRLFGPRPLSFRVQV